MAEISGSLLQLQTYSAGKKAYLALVQQMTVRKPFEIRDGQCNIAAASNFRRDVTFFMV
jgi:hypothetical protein